VCVAYWYQDQRRSSNSQILHFPVEITPFLSIYNSRVALHICLLSPLKQRDEKQQNFACRCVPSVCRAFAGSYVDKGHHILFKFLNVNKFAVNSFGRWTVGHPAYGARPPSGWEHGAAGLRSFSYSNALCRQSPRRSAQRDRHGAFKPKPSIARFWLALIMSFALAIKSQKCQFPAPSIYLYLFSANTNPNPTYTYKH